MRNEKKATALSLSELIAHVGEANINVQTIDLAAVNAQATRHGTELTICTTAMSPADLLLISQGGAPTSFGLILWMPREKAEEAKRVYEQIKKPATPSAP